jgi:effector-binding domain-containing protein
MLQLQLSWFSKKKKKNTKNRFKIYNVQIDYAGAKRYIGFVINDGKLKDALLKEDSNLSEFIIPNVKAVNIMHHGSVFLRDETWKILFEYLQSNPHISCKGFLAYEMYHSNENTEKDETNHITELCMTLE